MSKWKPIETAPKDGTRILLWFPNDAVAVSGLWYKYPEEREGPHVFSESFFDWSVDNDLIIMDDLNKYPTHWMPLPEPPNE